MNYFTFFFSHTQPYESISRRVPSWSFFPACDDENQRVYIRLRSADAVHDEVILFMTI